MLNLGSRGRNVVIEIVVRGPYMTLAFLIIRYRIGSRKYDRACFIIVLVFFLVAQQTQNLVENSYRDSIPFHPKPRLQKILQPSNSISVVSWFFYRKFDAEIYHDICFAKCKKFIRIFLVVPWTQINEILKLANSERLVMVKNIYFTVFSFASSNLTKTYFMVYISSSLDVSSIPVECWYHLQKIRWRDYS